MKTVTFGEIMLRLTVPGGRQIFDADGFSATFGGAEANVAADLSKLGADASYITKLPRNDLGDAALAALGKFGVDTSRVLRGGDRIGVYYLEPGSSYRASKVVYDRAGSAIAGASAGEFDWEKILDGADAFHLTGITPALSPALPGICLDALETAKKKGIKVYFDPNYRAKLWTAQAAGKTMEKLLPYVDTLITNESQAAELFGVKAPAREINGDDVSDAGYLALAEGLALKYGIKNIALTERRTFSARDNSFCGKLYDGKTLYVSRKYRITDIVDRVGAGDAFAAGLIFADGAEFERQKAVDFATASAVLKHTVPGDFNTVSRADIEALAAGNSSGRVKR